MNLILPVSILGWMAAFLTYRRFYPRPLLPWEVQHKMRFLQAAVFLMGALFSCFWLKGLTGIYICFACAPACALASGWLQNRFAQTSQRSKK